MTVLRNNFATGPDGTIVSVANSGNSGDNAFNAVSGQGTGCTFQFASAAALGRGTAEFALHVATTSTAHSEGILWTTSMGTQTQVWWRFYCRLSGTPLDITTIFCTDNGSILTGGLDIVTGSHLTLWNGPDTVTSTSTNVVTQDVWFRVEGRFQYSTTVGNADVQVYLEPDSDTPTETLSISGCNMGAANSSQYTFGFPFGYVNLPSMYLSGLELNNTGFPGPLPFIRKGVPGIQPNPIAIHTDTW